MRSNQLSAVLFSLLALPLVACGGDDDGGGTVVVPDAKVFMDAPPQALPCVLEAQYPAFTLPSEGRATNDWIRVGMQGSLMGVTFFQITVVLDKEDTTEVSFFVPKPANGFEANVPYPFDTDPKSTALTPASYAAENDTAGNPTRLLWASNGTITFSEVGQQMGNNITAIVSSTNYREIDEDGNDVAGGCTTTFEGITLNLTQKTTVNGPSLFAPTKKVDWSQAAKSERVTIKR